MRPWLLRGLGMALLHAVADTALAKATVYEPTGLTTTRIVVIALLVGAAVLWSSVDSWRRREEPGRTWLIAALLAGPASGVLYVIGRALFVDQTGTGELWPALTGGAAFTALLVLIPAGLGILAGSRLTPPRATPAESAAPTAGSAPVARAGKPSPRPRA
ncbi:B-4DMT family transporter [Amycolatopsis cynarae]|uniref:B-4DMT family transporter n=1 Tax=Amycolatopsis cynarae TaxID=2995223 RepID=A0ABY7AT17_9PSEU|nr:B-4DMT family transporter [Amycolatopsis sp. HUAS 11-8]WAL63100.1 B-4DMT family transporter [Amycolatopsis sp. HUAS 11-8]